MTRGRRGFSTFSGFNSTHAGNRSFLSGPLRRLFLTLVTDVTAKAKGRGMA